MLPGGSRVTLGPGVKFKVGTYTVGLMSSHVYKKYLLSGPPSK